MTDLIELSDLEDRLGFQVDNSARALALIADVSAAIRVYTGQDFDEVPPAVAAVAAQIVARAWGVQPSDAGIAQESLGSYSYSVGAAAAAGPLGWLNDERAILDLYRRRVRTIQHGSWL